jgi:hypothetical protein
MLRNALVLCLLVAPILSAGQDYPRAEIFGGYSYFHLDTQGVTGASLDQFWQLDITGNMPAGNVSGASRSQWLECGGAIQYEFVVRSEGGRQRTLWNAAHSDVSIADRAAGFSLFGTAGKVLQLSIRTSRFVSWT